MPGIIIRLAFENDGNDLLAVARMYAGKAGRKRTRHAG